MIVSKSGRELFKHHIDTTDGLTFNCSANHLLVLFVLKGTIFLLFADFMFFFSAVNIAKNTITTHLMAFLHPECILSFPNKNRQHFEHPKRKIPPKNLMSCTLISLHFCFYFRALLGPQRLLNESSSLLIERQMKIPSKSHRQRYCSFCTSGGVVPRVEATLSCMLSSLAKGERRRAVV